MPETTNLTGNSEIEPVLHASVPIFRRVNLDPPELVASAILYRKEAQTFLITAGHVIRDFGETIYVPLKIGEYLPHGLLYAISKNGTAFGSKDDTIDVAAIHLDDPSPLSGEYLILTSNNLILQIPEDQLHKIAFVLCGFPWRQSKVSTRKKSAVAKTLAYYCQHAPISAFRHGDFEEKYHYALEYHRRTLIRGTKTRVIAPMLHGVSGGGVWVQTDARDFRLAAIPVDWDQNHALVHATKIGNVLGKLALELQWTSL
jgi:hypothetical protein